MHASLLGPSYTGVSGRVKPLTCAFNGWALRGSNPRPSPCKGDALPAELSARLRGVTARSTDHVSELDPQPRAATRCAPVQAFVPARFRLAGGADQDLTPARHRPR